MNSTLLRHQVAPFCPCGKENKDGKYNPDVPKGSGWGHCHSCGQNFLAELPENTTLSTLAKRKEPPPEAVAKAVPDGVRLRAQSCEARHYGRSALATWLATVLGPEAAGWALAHYYVGTTRDGWAAFWHTDTLGRVRTCKAVRYGAGGKRDKDIPPRWPLHREEGHGLTPCLFGEHLLHGRHQAPVLVVESEKTALLAAAYWPELVVVATGGATGLTGQRAAVLHGRRVAVCFDADRAGREGAARALDVLARAGVADATALDVFDSRTDGWDIGDELVALYSAGTGPRGEAPVEVPPEAAVATSPPPGRPSEAAAQCAALALPAGKEVPEALALLAAGFELVPARPYPATVLYLPCGPGPYHEWKAVTAAECGLA